MSESSSSSELPPEVQLADLRYLSACAATSEVRKQIEWNETVLDLTSAKGAAFKVLGSNRKQLTRAVSEVHPYFLYVFGLAELWASGEPFLRYFTSGSIITPGWLAYSGVLATNGFLNSAMAKPLLLSEPSDDLSIAKPEDTAKEEGDHATELNSVIEIANSYGRFYRKVHEKAGTAAQRTRRVSVLTAFCAVVASVAGSVPPVVPELIPVSVSFFLAGLVIDRSRQFLNTAESCGKFAEALTVERAHREIGVSLGLGFDPSSLEKAQASLTSAVSEEIKARDAAAKARKEANLPYDAAAFVEQSPGSTERTDPGLNEGKGLT